MGVITPLPGRAILTTAFDYAISEGPVNTTLSRSRQSSRTAVCLLIFVITGFCTALPLAAQNDQSARPANRIVDPIDEQSLVPLKGNIHPLAQSRFDRGPAPVSTPTGRIFMLFRRSDAQQQALSQYLADLQNSASPHFHKWLTPAQYGTQFGISEPDLAMVEAWMQSHGFKIENVPQARNMIEFSGNFDQLKGAFHTSIHSFQVNGKMHLANVSDPQIPTALAPVVAGVGPLNDFYPSHPLHVGPRGHFDPTTNTFKPDLTLYSNTLFVDPADAATIYDTPNTKLNANYTSGTTYDGTGVNIGIVGDSNIPLQDIQNFRTAFLGETTANVNLPTVVVDGQDPGLTGNVAELEAILDNEMAGGLAPGAKIYFYTSADTALSIGAIDSLFRALDDNTVSIISMSLEECEPFLGSTWNALTLEDAEQAAAQGISVVVSSSDSGSAGCDNFDTESQAVYGLAVNGLGSTPYNISVGGTDFDVLPNAFSTYASTSIGSAPYYRTALKYIPENPWNDSTTVNTTYANNVPYLDQSGYGNIIAGSGGVSSIYTKPSYQASLTPADGARDLPDISLLAANGFYNVLWLICADSGAYGETGTVSTDCQNTNGNFTSSTTLSGAGGTSASAPAFAGIVALLEQKAGSRLGQINYVLYQLAQAKYSTVFHDITVGNNSVPCVSGSPNCGSNGFITGYNAGTRYDLASGLGSVDVAALLNNWSSVSLAATSTALKINGGTAAINAVHGTSLNFSVAVTPSTAGGVAGIVDTANVTSGGTTKGPQVNSQFAIPLTSGTGSQAWNGLPGGTYTVSANYPGDTSHACSKSESINVTITPESSSMALWLYAFDAQTGNSISNLNSIPYGSYLFLASAIFGEAEGTATQGIATGSVTFYDNSATLGAAQVTSQCSAACPYENLAVYPDANAPYPAFGMVGSHNATAKYSGDVSYKAGTSSAVAFTVVKASTGTTASASPTAVTSQSSTTVTVSVATPVNYGLAPSGSVTLTSGAKTLATISSFTTTTEYSGSTLVFLLTGSAAISGSQLAVGSNSITAKYSGDANYASSTGTVNVMANSTGLEFIPVTPCRVADTRNATGAFGGPAISGGSSRAFNIPQSACNIPSNAAAYSLNVTVVPSKTLDYLTLWPAGQSQPNVSTLNSLDGRIKANAAIVPAGTSGAVSVFVSDTSNVILDIDGYFVPAGSNASALAFYPLAPCRIADTRNATGSLGGPSIGGASSRAFPILSSSCNIPSTAKAYSLNVTAIPHKTLNYLTTWPTGQAQPNVSTLNAPTGTIVANAAIVPAGTTGQVSIFVSDASDVILDVNGYFAPPASGGLSLYTVTPCRVIDTRPSAFNGVLPVTVEGSTCAPPSSAEAYVLNATAVPPAALTYLTLWPAGESQPNVSTLNALDGAITSNMAIVPTTNGSIDAFSSNPTNLILDISSYFAP